MSKISAMSEKQPQPVLLCKKKKKRLRCCTCKTKISAYIAPAMTCKCNKLFCGVHIHEHNCTFDFHGEAQKLLETQNPVVKPPRLRERL